MDKKEILEALNFRHACKEFDPSKKISEDELNIILALWELNHGRF